MARVDKGKRALGGAIKRNAPGKAAAFIHARGWDRGRVLDYGCGHGFDADHFGWEAYDPYYRPALPQGQFDTIVCQSVLNALSRNNRAKVVAGISAALKPDGCAFLAVPRGIPKGGKLGINHSVINHVVLDLESVHSDAEVEIYRMLPGQTCKDKTLDFVSDRDRKMERGRRPDPGE